ncbi:bifunctional 3'-5' exonuclease/DNA polymerase [Hydrogenivirga sp. 128-5-R1-1]|uniref:bifunctional 3'-5' exonuclease/DNA polymerase n=1 Tax=Hydrogenivirga sp. 128-5-R1-1 TaxID=392423 RepID=UPI00015EF90A|nr:bifunctional 3'-5' exonuclease/DNA polymerase [Hydrogenivirga sp. 128-5-R1-1]EDP75113.1 DNA polymerase I (PolI) [Hydrogenivirga sp. 128-5-R1-1]
MKYEYVTEKAHLGRAVASLERVPYLFIDTETTGDRIRLFQVGDEERIFVIDLFDLPEAVDVLKELIAKKGVVGHNLKFDLKFMYPLGIVPYATFDTMIGSFLLGYERHSLSHVAERLLGYTMDKSLQLSDWSRTALTKQQIEYAATDVLVVRELFYKMREKLNALGETDRGEELLRTRTARVFGLTNPATVVEMAFVQEIARLEMNGIPVDEEEIERLSREYEKKLQKLIMDFYIKYRIDPMSPKQIGSFLTGRLGLELPETQKGNISTDDKTLAEFSHVKEVRDILEIRRIKKALDKLKELKGFIRNGRVYPEFRQIGAVTGRMSSSNPNVQNIPRDMRSLFRASEGNLFVIADFSQIELRIAAEYVQDENMLRAFREGRDLHRYTASLVLEKPEEEITKEERQLAKAMNFGLIYGISARGLSEYARSSYGVELEIEAADVFRQKFFKFFHAFKDWHDSVKRELKENKEVVGTTLLGRPYRASTFTDAVNYPIQGTGADLLKLAVLMFDVETRKKGLSARVVNLVHDEIVVECPQELAEQIKESLEHAMVHAGSIVLKHVPVEVESVVDERWVKG